MHQITVDTWSQHGAKTGLTDFSPKTQDLMAVEILRSIGVTDKIKAGDVAGANGSCCRKMGCLTDGSWLGQSLPSSAFRQFRSFLSELPSRWGYRKMRLSCVQIVIVASLTVMLASSGKAEGENGSGNSRQTAGIEGLRLKVGESFLEARSRIIRLGWTPIRMHSDDNYEYDGAEKRLAPRNFLEVDSCSIDAGANCILYYSKAAKCLGNPPHRMIAFISRIFYNVFFESSA